MGDFFRRIWINIQRFFRWIWRQKFTKITLRELFTFAIAFVIITKVSHLTFFVFFYTFIGAYFVSFFTFEWVLSLGKRKNDFLIWVSRFIALYVIYAIGQTFVNNIMPRPHDIKYYFAGFIAGILGYLISNAIKRMK
jgi:hypothetical protein